MRQKDFDLRGLADLFTLSQHLSLDVTSTDDPLCDAIREYSETDAARERVSQALTELLHNPQTPADLYEAITGFVSEGVNNNLVHSAPVVSHLIALLNDPIGKYQGA